MGAFALSGNSVWLFKHRHWRLGCGENVTGSFNTVIGDRAGQDITTGNDNIYIGATAGNGAGNESGMIRIGDPDFI